MASRSKSTPQWLNSSGENEDLDNIISEINTTLTSLKNNKANKAGWGGNRLIYSDLSGNLAALGSTLPGSKVMVTDGSGLPSASSITTTKLGYLTDVTSNIQAQLGTKENVSDANFYVCYIVDTPASSGSPETFQWTGSPGNYSYTIPRSKHGKGKRANYSNYFPRVKTYSLVSGNQWEETYDSSAIDISTGNVTVYSNANTPKYMIIIW